MAPARIAPLEAPRAALAPRAKVSRPAQGASFAEVLRGQQTAKPSSEVRFSAHARQRLEQRGVRLGPKETARIGQALDQAAAKGARETLLLFDHHALIASVPNRTVITAMTPDAAQGAVFTQIDSAVVVPAEAPAGSNGQPTQATKPERDPFGDAVAPRIDRSGATRG